MIFDENLHLKSTKLELHPPWMILVLGFGMDKALGMIDGQYITVEKIRGFLLSSCGHIITSHEDLAGSCSWCQDSLLKAGHPYPEWASLICTKCASGSGCMAPFCPHQVLCPRHVARQISEPEQTPLTLCALHFTELDGAISLQQIELEHGRAASRSVSFLKSLFLKQDNLPE